ncbi:hypothetical protein C5B42_04870 [Candidatus Cerribacteria bacterium 'Amazon FNV 2010 28 9']|uniref:General secretion pathway GspH domain-containing protein n=1 Tax=Candidatus Cerribacteria bacterium 'Amazon FNV 2010 28 9' TaxID=2081795 RepID=A0A317JML2_9BACT|nr:MAG: hypothetical protein C5B42_04870 [Candidatus Cerribacteria bacterium 'Amazon FNV 2010 28 9']
MSRCFGYTLIELVVVIGIIALLVGGSVAGYSTLNNRQLVLTSGKEVESVMRTAQQRAISGEKPSGCTNLLGYNVTAANGSSAYTLNAICSGNTTIKMQSDQLRSGVTFGTAINVLFIGQVGGVSGTTGTISVKSSSHTFTFTLSSSGDISEVGLQ